LSVYIFHFIYMFVVSLMVHVLEMNEFLNRNHEWVWIYAASVHGRECRIVTREMFQVLQRNSKVHVGFPCHCFC